MKYTKPSISLLGGSVWAVRGSSTKLIALLIDSLGCAYVITLIAYEADE